MKSLKQKGNEAFKAKKYKQAIKYYDEYVQQQHADNKNAYFNLGLCYSRIHQSQKSIQACKSAIALDPDYQKAYYRLMKDYVDLGNSYQILINAFNYIRTEKDRSSSQINEAQQYLKIYKNRLKQKSKNSKPKNEIDSLFQDEKPILEQHPQFNQQIDKYPNEWIEEWNQNIQSQDAKWEEIAYIIRQFDINYGLSLAYLYLNQIKDKEHRKEIRQKIKELKTEMKVLPPSIEDQDCQLNNQGVIIHGLDQTCQFVFQQQKNIQTEKLQTKDTSFLPSVSQNIQVKPQPTQKISKIQDMLSKKSQMKRGYQNVEDANENQTKIHHKPKELDIKQQAKEEVGYKKQEQKIIKEQQIQKNSENQLEQLYTKYCGNLEKTKDIFNQMYKSIFSILNGKQSQTNKGSLLILIKKRVKKFKLIVASFSENEQKIIFDLLQKCKIQEYAVDFAPAYYKV